MQGGAGAPPLEIGLRLIARFHHLGSCHHVKKRWLLSFPPQFSLSLHGYMEVRSQMGSQDQRSLIAVGATWGQGEGSAGLIPLCIYQDVQVIALHRWFIVTPQEPQSLRCHSTPFPQAGVWKTQQLNPTNRVKCGSNHTLAIKEQFKQRINNKCHPHSILWSQEKPTQGLLENLLHQDKICHYCYKSMWSKMWWCAANPIPSSKASTQAPGKITGVRINLSKQTALTSYLNYKFNI